MSNLEVPISAQIEQYRQKAAAGNMTMEDARAAVALLRQGRRASADAPKAAKKGAGKKIVDTDALLDELDGI